jgi:hypothetical protein
MKLIAWTAVLMTLAGPAAAQESYAERAARLSRAADEKGLAEPFKGITRDGTVEPGLFSIRTTGVSTAPVVTAARSFVGTLTEAQRAKTLFPVDDDEWRKWMNPHFYVRQGVSFGEMSTPQREAAIALLRAALSARGLQQSQDIMRLNHTLGELTGRTDEYGEGRYWITIMGTPSAREPWGWQLDGHHLNINYFVLGDQVVMTPTFLGSEPTFAEGGKYKGVRVLNEEERQGLSFINSLREAHRRQAILQPDKSGNNALAEAFKDNLVLDYAGLRADALTKAEQETLLALVGVYVGAMPEGHARVRMDEVRQHIDRTHFAWIGGTSPDSTFYYRIHSPVVLIEFDHQVPVGLRGKMPDGPTHAHIHTVIRTPNGNDYGKDLLRQHYAAHPHP